MGRFTSPVWQNIAVYDDLDAADPSVLVGLTGHQEREQAAAPAMTCAAPGCRCAAGDDRRREVRVSQHQERQRRWLVCRSKANELNQSHARQLRRRVDRRHLRHAALGTRLVFQTPVAGPHPDCGSAAGQRVGDYSLASTALTFTRWPGCESGRQPWRPTATATVSQLGTAKQTLTVAKLGRQ